MSRCARRAATPRDYVATARRRRTRARASTARPVELLRWEDASASTSFERAFPAGGRYRTELWTRAEASATGGEPVVGVMSSSCAALLELSCEEANEATFAALAGGESAWRKRARANAYAGHQFGKWAGALGDGRCITMGTVLSDDFGAFEVQLKGAGKTAYSRHGDGRASLRSALREFFASEAMAALGVRTTRALCVTATNDGVVRQTASNKTMLLPGGVLTRVFERCGALRFGTFEWPASRGDDDTTRALADYVIACGALDGELESVGCDDSYGSFLCAVARRSGELVAKWQAIGFVHGVMNTDNASVLGLTIDYGPFGFMEAFDEQYSPNVDDDTGMYVYASQPSRMRWNVERLCDAFARIARRARDVERSRRSTTRMKKRCTPSIRKSLESRFVIRTRTTTSSVGFTEFSREAVSISRRAIERSDRSRRASSPAENPLPRRRSRLKCSRTSVARRASKTRLNRTKRSPPPSRISAERTPSRSYAAQTSTPANDASHKTPPIQPSFRERTL